MIDKNFTRYYATHLARQTCRRAGPPDTDCPLGGGAFAPFWEILDMKRFFTDYCLTFLEKVGHGGKCGNVWFASRESWYDVEKN